jgi:hypothetical protein
MKTTTGVRYDHRRFAGTVVVSLGLSACGGPAPGPAEKPAATGPPTIEVVRVLQQPVDATLSLPGELNPYQAWAPRIEAPVPEREYQIVREPQRGGRQ